LGIVTTDSCPQNRDEHRDRCRVLNPFLYSGRTGERRASLAPGLHTAALSRAVWDDQLVADIAAAWAAGHLDDGDAVLIVDETADEKSSGTAADAARQDSGTAGGIALCQVAVTVTYTTGRGHALIDRALYPARSVRRR